MATIKINNVTALTESGGTVVLDSAVTGIPAAGVTGVLPVGVTGGSGLTALGTVASGTINIGVKLSGITSISAFALGTGDTSQALSLSYNTRYLVYTLNKHESTTGEGYPVVSILNFGASSGSLEAEANGFAGNTVWTWAFSSNVATLRVNHANYRSWVSAFKIGAS